MRFQIGFEQHKQEWIIVATEGEFAGREVARAEGLLLRDVVFKADKMFGSIGAAWGIVLVDEVTTSLPMLKALGIGRPFKGIGAVTLQFRFERTAYFCSESDRVMMEASHVLLMKQGMFYARERSAR